MQFELVNMISYCDAYYMTNICHHHHCHFFYHSLGELIFYPYTVAYKILTNCFPLIKSRDLFINSCWFSKKAQFMNVILLSSIWHLLSFSVTTCRLQNLSTSCISFPNFYGYWCFVFFLLSWHSYFNWTFKNSWELV